MDIKNPADRGRWLGNPAQLYGIEKMTAAEGFDKGSAYYFVNNGAGLSYRLSADCALDIAALSYRGINIHFLTKNGYRSPYAFSHFESDFIHTFPAGMMYTCGLMSTGGANRDDGVWHPAHGRFHSIPAGNLAADIQDGDKLTVAGTIRETQFNGHSLEVRRTVCTPVGENTLTLRDRLTNQTPEPCDYMLLYHFNFGWPFLSPDLKMIVPEGTQTSPRDSEAKKQFESRFSFGDPIDWKPEEVYFNTVPAVEGEAALRLENPVLGFGVEIFWSVNTLPVAAHWKYMKSGEYVLGIEPTNSFIMGRHEEKKNGTIAKIEPFQTKETEVGLRFYDL